MSDTCNLSSEWFCQDQNIARYRIIWPEERAKFEGISKRANTEQHIFVNIIKIISTGVKKAKNGLGIGSRKEQCLFCFNRSTFKSLSAIHSSHRSKCLSLTGPNLYLSKRHGIYLQLCNPKSSAQWQNRKNIVKCRNSSIKSFSTGT